MGSRSKSVPMNFASMAQKDVPQGRNGKHKEIVTKILSDLDLDVGDAATLPVHDHAVVAQIADRVRLVVAHT